LPGAQPHNAGLLRDADLLHRPGHLERLVERTRTGQQRARAAGTHMGRPFKTTEAQRQAIRSSLVKGETVTAAARDFKVRWVTVLTVRDNARPR